MKGGEGRFLVILLVIACISDDYVDMVKGFLRFAFQIFDFYLLLPNKIVRFCLI